jgi:UDPglucose 6-dehydrogenase
MRISVIGCGYLGAVHSACMAALGHDVVGIDVDEHKIAELSAGRAPFFEPGLAEALTEAIATGRLRFSTDIAEARDAQIHFIAVGTPQLDGEDAADIRFVDAAVASLLPHLSAGDLVVGKSTVPLGTAARLAPQIAATGAVLAWNPEFLREGYAVRDTMEPDRLVYGVPTGTVTDPAVTQLDEVYAVALANDTPRVVTDYATAELVKVAANAFLATKISFINAMAEIAETADADVTQLADAIGYDVRIGRRFLNAGLGFGGGCLPKDIRAFRARAEELGREDSVTFLREVDSINLRRRQRMIDLTRELVGGELSGTTVAVLGLSFKPDSDDVRDSPALDIAARLAALGARVVATDPAAIELSRRLHPEIEYRADAREAAEGADIVLIATEWKQYRAMLPEVLSGAAGRILLDGRNCVDPDVWTAAGWDYHALGRPSRLATGPVPARQ